MKKYLAAFVAAIAAVAMIAAPSFATQIQPRGSQIQPRTTLADGDYSYDEDEDEYTLTEDDAAAVGGILGALAGFALIVNILSIAVSVFLIVCNWKIFTKAGQEGWKSIIPIYNMVVMCQIANIPTWWVILMIVPLANFVAAFYISYKFVAAFGKGVGFYIGYLLCSPIFCAILAFDKKIVYVGKAPTPTPATAGAAPAAPAADPWVSGQAPAAPATPATPAAPQQGIPPMQPTQPDNNNPFIQQPGQPQA